MARKKKKVKTLIETYESIRRDWGGVSPVTKIIPNKKAYSRKEKHSSRPEELFKIDKTEIL